MKKTIFCFMISLLLITCAYAQRDSWNEGDLDMASDSIDGHPTTGLYFDPDNDGTNEFIFQADGDLQLSGYTIDKDDGNDGDVLTSDGAGAVAFEAPASSGDSAIFEDDGAITQPVIESTNLSLGNNLSVNNNVEIENTLKVDGVNGGVLWTGGYGVAINASVEPPINTDLWVYANSNHAVADAILVGGSGGTARLDLYSDAQEDTNADRSYIIKNDSADIDIFNNTQRGISVDTSGTVSIRDSGVAPIDANSMLEVHAGATHCVVAVRAKEGGQAQFKLQADDGDDGNADLVTMAKLNSGNFSISNNGVAGYTMDTAGASTLLVATATTLDTGQGANELYDMDQNVLETNNVTFNGIYITGDLSATGSVDIDTDLNVDGSADIDGNLSVDSLNVRTIAGAGSGVASIGNLDVQTNLTVSGDLLGGPQVLSKSGNYTLVGSEVYNTILYVDGAATITLPAISTITNAEKVCVVVHTIGDVAVSVDPNGADYLILDGVVLDDGDKATNKSDSADCIIITYFSADGFYASSGSLTTPFTWADGS